MCVRIFFFFHILHYNQNFPSFISSKMFPLSSLSQVTPSQLFLQKWTGLPEITAKDSISNFSKARHLPLY